MPPPAQAFTGIVTHKIVSVASKISFVLRKLYTSGKVKYDALFEKAESRSDLVATFLALLELVKQNRVTVNGEGTEQQVEMLGDYHEGDEQELIQGMTIEDGD